MLTSYWTTLKILTIPFYGQSSLYYDNKGRARPMHVYKRLHYIGQIQTQIHASSSTHRSQLQQLGLLIMTHGYSAQLNKSACCGEEQPNAVRFLESKGLDLRVQVQLALQ